MVSKPRPWRVCGGGTIVLLIVVALISGCTHAIPLKGTIESPSSLAKVPAKVGVYYSSEFRNYRYVGSRGGDRWDFPLGSASVTLFDQTFPLLFAQTEPVTGRPPLSGGDKLNGVIEPKIESFDFTLPFLKTGTYMAEITYRFTLYTPKGAPVASWLVKGKGAKPGQVGFDFARWPGEAANLAMRDAATKFLNGFSDVPEVQPWLRQLKK